MKNVKRIFVIMLVSVMLQGVFLHAAFAQQTILESQSFESAAGTTPPPGWDIELVTGTIPGISFVSSATNPAILTAFDGTIFASYNSYGIAAGSTRLRQTSPMTTTDHGFIMVDFMWYEDPGNATANDKVDVQWSTNGTTWNNAGSFMRYNTVAGWKAKNVVLPTSADNQASLYVSFLFTSANGNNCALDYVRITEGPPLPTAFAYIGAGTVPSVYPYTTSWQGGRTQLLYTAAELNAAGVVSGNLSSVGFNVISYSPQAMNGFSIKIGATTLSSLSAGYVPGLTTYYTASYAVPGTGWQSIPLTTPFAWNGTSNVVVELCYANTSGTSDSPVTSTGMPGMVAGHYGNSVNECTVNTNNAPANRPNIRLGIPTPVIPGVLRGYVREMGTLATVAGAIVRTGNVITVSQNDGSYIFYNMTPGSVSVNAHAAGYISGSSTAIIISGGITNTTIFLTPGPQVSGVVTDASTGAPIIGAVVMVGTGAATVSTLTLPGGTYITPMLSISGSQPYMATKTGYDTFYGVVTLVPGLTTSQDLALLPTARPPGIFTATLDNPANPEAVNLSWLPPQGFYELIYDDGIQEDFSTCPAENNLNAIRFTPLAWPAKITGGSLNLGTAANYPSNALPFTPFKIIAFKADGPGGLPGSLLDSIVVTATTYGWISFTFPAPVTLNSGDFYLAMKQAGTAPHAAGIAVDATTSQSRSFALDVSSAGTWTPVTGNFMIRAIVQGAGGPLPGDNSGSGDEPLSMSYQVWRFLQGQENSQALWTPVWTGAGTTAIDNEWPILPSGAYRWAVKAIYSPPGIRYSAPSYSNVIGNNWTADVNVCVSLSCAANAKAGTLVMLTNTAYPDTLYTQTTDTSGCVHFAAVWKGTYTLKVLRFSYQLYTQTIAIAGNETYNVSLVQHASPANNLTVNNTNLQASWTPATTVIEIINESWASGSFSTNQWVTSGGTNWQISTNIGNPVPCAIFNWSPVVTNYNQYLTSKSFSGSHAPQMILSYDMSLSNSSSTILNTMAVELWDGATWSVLRSYNNSAGSIPWISESVDISSVTNSSAFKIRFNASGIDSYNINYWSVDNIKIKSIMGAYGTDPCVTGYNFYLNGALLGFTTDTAYAIPPGMVTYGQPYSACVEAVFGPSVSTQVCATFTSYYLYPPLNLTGTFAAGTTTLNWNLPTVPAGLTGYNIYRNNILMNPTPVALLTYADTPVPYGLNSYAVRAVYGMNESLNAGPVVINAVPMLHSVNDVTISNGMTGCYNATQTIAVAGNGTTFNVEAGGSATMIAGQNIQYFPGTTVGDGGYMWGYIAPAGPFCTIPTLPVAASAGENPTADPAISSFRIYPNPTNGTFRLMPGDALTQENTRVEIFSIWGEKVVQQTVTGGQYPTFSLSGMPAGVYFIRVIRGNHAATGKIVKR